MLQVSRVPVAQAMIGASFGQLLFLSVFLFWMVFGLGLVYWTDVTGLPGWFEFCL